MLFYCQLLLNFQGSYTVFHVRSFSYLLNKRTIESDVNTISVYYEPTEIKDLF